MLRLSSYLIISEHLMNGGYAILSGVTGAMELINEDLYQILSRLSFDNDPRSRCIDNGCLPPEIMATFVKRGYITEYSHEDEREIVKKIAADLHEISTKQCDVVIVPDLDCNYRCDYCYERPLQNKIKEHKIKMDKPCVDNFFHSIDLLTAESRYISGTVTLYGGEPLRAENKEIVDYIVAKGAEKGYIFNAVTNGHNLDAYLGLLGREKIAHIQITIDGPKEVHDRRRIAIDGSSSYEKIMNNMRQAISETDVLIGIRVNLDGDNYRAFGELMNTFDQEGWFANNRIKVGAAIVTQRDQRGAIYPILDINVVKAELFDVMKKYPKIIIGGHQAADRDEIFSLLASDMLYSFRSRFCASCSGMYIFLPDGTISACWDSVGEECSYIGSYSEDGLFLDMDKISYRFNRSVVNISACLDCKYCLVCAGGCPQHAEYNTHDFYQPHCGDFPDTFPWVLAEAVEKYLQAHCL